MRPTPASIYIYQPRHGGELVNLLHRVLLRLLPRHMHRLQLLPGNLSSLLPSLLPSLLLNLPRINLRLLIPLHMPVNLRLHMLVNLRLRILGRHAPPPPQPTARRRRHPQKHINQIQPHGPLHARNALLALGILRDVHLAENAKQHQPEHAQQRLPHKERQLRPGMRGNRRGRAPPALQVPQRHQVDAGCDDRNARRPLGIHPLRVGVHPLLAGVVQVDAVHADDGQRQAELEEPQGEVDVELGRLRGILSTGTRWTARTTAAGSSVGFLCHVVVVVVVVVVGVGVGVAGVVPHVVVVLSWVSLFLHLFDAEFDGLHH
jgi:hypothetical protein